VQQKLGSLRASTLSHTDAVQVLTLIGKLKEALEQSGDADVEWQDIIRDGVIRATSLLVCSALFTVSSSEWPQLRENILQGATLAAPVFNKEYDDDFATRGIIAGSAPRANAAQALMALASKETDQEQLTKIHDHIRSLAKDKMGAVRASIAGEVHLLWKKKDSAFAWEIIDGFVGH
jgi:hypothetical protein